MKVGILALQHESNTFSARETTLADFENGILARGREVDAGFRDSFHEIAGFFEGLETGGIEPVSIFAAKAPPQGPVTTETFERLLEMLFHELDRAGPLDGVLVAPHGAGVTENEPDMDGFWLTRVRERVGEAMPVICTLDPHANLSRAMVDACDATIAYATNPHIDQKERGLEAARLMVATLRGEARPVQAAVLPPIAINIERQLTREEPCLGLYKAANDVRARPGVLSTSILLGFPYADVAKMGSAAIVVTDGDKRAASAYAGELGGYLWENRELFRGEMIGIEPALELAQASPGPVLLLDMGDNAGGGAPSDGTLLASAILSRPNLRGFVSLRDPECVRLAAEAGAGARLHLDMGGKTDTRHGPPLRAEARVVGLYEGRFRESEPRHGGRVQYDMGPTAVVETGGLTVMLTTKKTGSSSLQQLLSCDLDPARFDVIVAKGVHAPVAAYENVCPTRIRVNTPGVTRADMENLVFHHRRRPLFPFEES